MNSGQISVIPSDLLSRRVRGRQTDGLSLSDPSGVGQRRRCCSAILGKTLYTEAEMEEEEEEEVEQAGLCDYSSNKDVGRHS